MATQQSTITFARVREAFSYNEEYGTLIWQNYRSSSAPAGAMAGNLNPAGYLRIRFDNVLKLAHHWVWFYFHGRWPFPEIDHINGDPLDNRIENLREVCSRVNKENIRKPKKINVCGFLGVSRTRHRKARPWRADISVKGQKIIVGHFCSPEEAHEAYLLAKRRLHEGCTI